MPEPSLEDIERELLTECPYCGGIGFFLYTIEEQLVQASDGEWCGGSGLLRDYKRIQRWKNL